MQGNKNAFKCVPIDFLPDDILSSIFILASFPNPKCRDFDDIASVGHGSGSGDGPRVDENDNPCLDRWYSDEQNTRVAVTHVRRRWRLVALDTAVVWGRLNFVTPNPYAMSMEFFRRSREAPLSITVGRKSGGVSGLNLYKIFHDIVIPHFTRVQSLSISVRQWKSSRFQNLIDKIITLPAPLLEDFTLQECADSDTSILLPTSTFRSDAPRLRTICLFNLVVRWKPTRTDEIPLALFARLTTLKLRNNHGAVGPICGQFFEIITSSPNLGVLYLEFVLLPPTNGRLSRVFLPNLHKLSIEDKGPTNMTSIFRNLHMPKLKSLRLAIMSIGTQEHRAVEDCSLFFQELTTSRGEKVGNSYPVITGQQSALSNVQIFDLSGPVHCDPVLVPKIYSSMPNLHALRLNVRDLDNAFFDTLHTEPSTTSNLKVVFCEEIGTAHDLVALVRERERSGFGLQRLLVDRTYKPDILEEECGRKNVEFGIHMGKYE